MVITLLKFLPALYLFARTCVHKEPLKSKTETLFDTMNGFLVELKNSSSSMMVARLKKVAKKTFLFGFAALIVLALLPVTKYTGNIFMFIAIVIVLSVYVVASIEWSTDHKKTLKENFLHPVTLTIIFFPSIWFFLRDFLLLLKNRPPEFDKIAPVFNLLLKLSLWELIAVQLVWGIGVALFLYVGFSLVLLPLYIAIYGTIFCLIQILRAFEKYISDKLTLLDIIAAVLTLVVAGA